LPEFAAHRAPHDGWADVLATMEHDLRDSTSPSIDAAHAWQLPADLGPLPVIVRGRAERLLRAQQRAITALEKRMLVTGRHLAALDSIPSRSSSAVSAYLDVTG
jgi:hypothetical protein